MSAGDRWAALLQRRLLQPERDAGPGPDRAATSLEALANAAAAGLTAGFGASLYTLGPPALCAAFGGAAFLLSLLTSTMTSVHGP